LLELWLNQGLRLSNPLPNLTDLAPMAKATKTGYAKKQPPPIGHPAHAPPQGIAIK